MENKNKYIKVFLTPEEHQKVKELAGRCGFSESSYCRNKLFGKTPKENNNNGYFALLGAFREVFPLIKEDEESQRKYKELFFNIRSKSRCD